MVLSMWRTKRVLILSVVVSLSGLLMGTAQASDPTHLSRLMNTRSCVNCDLSGANLSGWTLAKTDLSGTDLTGAKMYKATLTDANLTGANFQDCDLTGANLKGATGAALLSAKTYQSTTCPDGYPGPCTR